jgi:hypothetical protein
MLHATTEFTDDHDVDMRNARCLVILTLEDLLPARDEKPIIRSTHSGTEYPCLGMCRLGKAVHAGASAQAGDIFGRLAFP